jgi:hypothetical protein
VYNNIPASNEAIITSTAGMDGVWLNGLPLSVPVISLAATFLPVSGTMYTSQLNLQRTQVIGHATIGIPTTAGTAETLYVCLYNAAGTTLLWSTNGTVNATGIDSFSATQYTAYPGVYQLAYEQTGTTGATMSALVGAGAYASIVNNNGKRQATAANVVSGSACPSTLGTLTASTASLAAIALEP